MKQDYFISIIDKNELTKPYSQFQLPLLPRVGDNVILGEEVYQVLEVNIQADKIMISQPDKKIVQINNAHNINEPGLIIPVLLICDISKLNNDDDKEENDEESK